MAFRLGRDPANNVRAKATAAITAAVDSGTLHPQARLLLYGGIQRVSPESPIGGTLLATINLDNPAFVPSDATGAAILASAPVGGTITTSGSCTWWSLVDRDLTPVMDGSAGLAGSGADITFDSNAFTAGSTVGITYFALQTPT